MKKEEKFYQQGDVILKVVDNLPNGMKVKEDKIVAEGEATGHMHRILAEDAMVFVTKEGDIFVDSPSGTEITHDEHDTINLPAGRYHIGIVQEFDPLEDEIRNVRD
jgi:hypothetical protein